MTARGEITGVAGLRVLVAEDDVLLREGIARLLTEHGCDVVAQAGDAEDLLRKGLAHRPDLVVADVRMPPRREDDGLAAAIELRRRLPEAGVLVLSQFYEESLAIKLIAEHPDGVGYLLKERVGDVASFIDCVRRVAAGGSALDPELVARMLRRRAGSGPLSELTPRERDVLSAMAEGKSNQGIADDLILSQAAVEKRVTAIMYKLGIGPTKSANRRVLAVLAYLRAGGSSQLD
jgi:DNA-binding NarL/FixJ family response regulator